jgi:hypothetical protein
MQLGRVDWSAASPLATAPATEPERPVWERLHRMAETLSEAREQRQAMAEEVAAQQADRSKFHPHITPKSKKLHREGFVEDRLIAGWADSLLALEERAHAEAQAQAERLAAEARADLAPTSTSRARRLVDEKLAGVPVHRRLYSEAANTRERLEMKRQQLVEEEREHERWDGRVLPQGDLALTRRGERRGTLARTPAKSLSPFRHDTPARSTQATAKRGDFVVLDSGDAARAFSSIVKNGVGQWIVGGTGNTLDPNVEVNVNAGVLGFYLNALGGTGGAGGSPPARTGCSPGAAGASSAGVLDDATADDAGDDATGGGSGPPAPAPDGAAPVAASAAG